MAGEIHPRQQGRTVALGVLALGTGARVARVVIGDALSMAGGGVAGGLVLAFAVAPFVQSLLFPTSARELAVMVFARAVLFGAAVVAAMLPARRAARVSPLVALRAD